MSPGVMGYLSGAVQIAALILAVIFIPHSFAALYIWNWDSRVRRMRNIRSGQYSRVMPMLESLTKISVVGMVILLVNFGIRVYAQLTPLNIEAHPIWDRAMFAVSSMALLAIAVIPSVFLLVVKWEVKTQDDTDSYAGAERRRGPLGKDNQGP